MPRGSKKTDADAGDDSLEKPWIEVVKSLLADLKKDINNEIQLSTKTVTNQLAEFKNCVEDVQAAIVELTNEKTKLEERVTDLTKQVDQCNRKQSALEKQNEELLQRQISIEAYNRRENLLVYGITQEPTENCHAKLRKFLKEELKIAEDVIANIKIQRCHRLNIKLNPQPIIVRFLFFPDRMSVWNARFNLKGTSISLSEDFPPEIVARRKVLYPILKAAKNDEKTCSLAGDKLKIDGKIYTVKTLHQLPQEYNPAKLATPEKNGITAFFTKASPLSNFYPCELVIDNCTYHSVEQYYQEKKAIFGKNPEIASLIRSTTDPAKCKNLGGKVLVGDNWLPFALDEMKRACWIKFSQNPYLKGFLRNTGDSMLVEAGPDKYWGVGLKLNDPNIHNKDSWDCHAQNRLGEVLMTIRKEL